MAEETQKRQTSDKPWQFKPGNKANPGGRPKENGTLRAIARKHTAAALKTLVACLKSSSDRTRVAAAEALLDRGYGKPSQAIEFPGLPLAEINVRFGNEPANDDQSAAPASDPA